MYADLKRKVCKKCEKTKDLNCFRYRTNKGSRNPHYETNCRPCEYLVWKEYREKNKESFVLRDFKRNLKRGYGMTVEEYNLKLEHQGNKCAICPAERSICGRRLAVDHNKQTGTIRGLLCNECNTALGLLKENPKLFLACIEYLDKFKK